MTTTYDDEGTSSFNQTSSGLNNISFSSPQQIVLALVPMLSGLISTVGSCMTLYVIWLDRKEQQQANHAADVAENNNSTSSIFGMNRAPRSIRLSVYHRIMIGLSVSDLICAIRMSTTIFLLPSDTVGVWKAFGNMATCTLQGFFAQLGGICSLLYTTSLSIYFFVTIVTNVHRDTMKRRIEPLLHAVPVLYGVSTSTIGIYLKAYNPVRFSVSCWVAPYPSMCLDDDNDVKCTRGENTEKLRWIFFQVPLFLCFVIIVSCMVSIFISVRQQLRKMEFRYGNGNHHHQSAKRLQKVATQSQLYIVVFFLVYFWSAVIKVLEFIHIEEDARLFFIVFLFLFFYPLQGFFNFFIFIRPRIVQIRVIHSTVSWIKALRIGLGFEQEPSTEIPVVEKASDGSPQKVAATGAPIVPTESVSQKNIGDRGMETSQDEMQKSWTAVNDTTNSTNSTNATI